MIMKFEDLFEAFRGANTERMPELTEERVYKFCNLPDTIKRIPVLSGMDSEYEVSGIVPNFLEEKEIKESKDKYLEKNRIRYFINKSGCLTMIRCGNAGKIFYRSSKEFPIFSLTTSIFAFFLKEENEIKEKYPEFDGLNLRWFYLKFNPRFNNIVKGDGLSTIPLSIINNVDLEIPSKEIQDREEKEYSMAINLRKNLKNLLDKAQKVLEKNLSLKEEYSNYDDIPASDIFDSTSGNSGLTEEFIYSKINQKSDKEYVVLSSSTLERTYMGEIPKCKFPNGDDLKVFEEKEGILVIRNGKAGKLTYLPKGDYTLNDHAYILSLKEDYSDKILLEWIIYQYQDLFYEFSSSSDNGTWNKTSFMNNAKIKIIPKKEQIKIIEIYSKLKLLLEKLNIIENKVESIFEKELVSITN